MNELIENFLRNKKNSFTVIGGVIVVLTFLGFQFNSAAPIVDIDNAHIFSKKLGVIFINKSAQTINDFNSKVTLIYPDENISVTSNDNGVLLGLNSRRTINFKGVYSKLPKKIIVCISFPGPFVIDTAWQKFELTPAGFPTTYYGASNMAGRNYIYRYSC